MPTLDTSKMLEVRGTAIIQGKEIKVIQIGRKKEN